MKTLSYRDASKEALAGEMRRDPTVWALGEDLGRGGVFGQYAGLAETFGPQRIVSTPISEATIMGAAVGAAMAGTRPVVELRFSDFALCAVDEMVNQAAKARYMLGGQTKVPVVIRQPVGLWRNSAAQHSQSLESWYIHVPGFVVIAPATPADNAGLLRAAIRCDDPVIYLEHKDLWDVEGAVPDGDDVLPIGKARTVRNGSDATIVTWSGGCRIAEAAADEAARQGIDVEIIDLRSLWPWDEDAVYAAVERTGRCIVLHEAVRVCGFGAEVAASVAERCAGSLKAPVRRVGAPRIPVPFSPPLEDATRVSKEHVLEALRSLG